MYIEERMEQLENTIKNLANEVEYLRAVKSEAVLTPKEFSEVIKINENTVYAWIREGRIKVLPNLGKALRIPMSQFYETKEEIEITPRKKESKAEQLKREFMQSLKEKRA